MNKESKCDTIIKKYKAFHKIEAMNEIDRFVTEYRDFYSEYEKPKVTILETFSIIEKDLIDTKNELIQEIKTDIETIKSKILSSFSNFLVERDGVKHKVAEKAILSEDREPTFFIDLLNRCLNSKYAFWSFRDKGGDFKSIYNNIEYLSEKFSDEDLTDGIIEIVIKAYKKLYTIQRIMPHMGVVTFLKRMIIDLGFPKPSESEDLRIEKKDVYDFYLNNIKPDKDEIYLLYKEYKEDLNNDVDVAFYQLIENLESINLDPQQYFKTDTPQNFDKAYREWFKKMRKENSGFLKKGSQLPKIRK